jgi:hypothetical protein
VATKLRVMQRVYLGVQLNPRENPFAMSASEDNDYIAHYLCSVTSDIDRVVPGKPFD